MEQDKRSLASRIQNYLQIQQGKWISGDELEKKSQSAGYKASTGSRRARELAEDGIISRKEVDGIVYYAVLDKPEPQYKYIHEFDEERKVMVEKKVLVTR